MPGLIRTMNIDELTRAFDSLSDRRVVLFGGKGGVGKTTLAALAALHLSNSRRVSLFTTDPASSLEDLFGDRPPGKLTIEPFDATALWKEFLNENLEPLLELGDRATWLDREELRRFFELSIPGIDELMAWRRIGSLAAQHPDRLLIVDTAPTGHTLRMLASSGHYRRFGAALDAMQGKHREIVTQLTRRNFRDRIDEYIEQFEKEAESHRELLSDPQRSAFVAVTLAEPWVTDQTVRLLREVTSLPLPVAFVVLNQASHDCDCASCRRRSTDESDAVRTLADWDVVRAPRACVPLDSVRRMRGYLRGTDPRARKSPTAPPHVDALDPGHARLLFFAGKGGVGKTTSATSVALQLAASRPGSSFTLISVDPAHSVRDVFSRIEPPPNLEVEIVDTRAMWEEFRESFGDEVRRAVGAITPRGLSLSHDEEIMQQLISMAPPGADELFAIVRLSTLLDDETKERILIDTAPTGHFLRLLELPHSAGEWVREFMRILLRYRNLLPPGSLGENLLKASRALREFEQGLRSPRSGTVVVLRPEPLVLAESRRLLDQLGARGIIVSGIIANAMTPPSDCPCDESRRAGELDQLRTLGRAVVLVDRRSSPPVDAEMLRSLVPLRTSELES